MNTKDLTTLHPKDFTPPDFDMTKQEKFKSSINQKIMPTEMETTEKVEKCKLRKELRFFILCLKMLGLFHFEPKWSKCSKRKLFFKIYSTIIMGLLWFDFFRCFALYSALDSDEAFLFLAVLYHLRTFICAISITCCYVMSQHGRGWHTFFTAWYEIAKCLDDPEIRKYLENKLRSYLAMIWVLVGLIMSFSIYCIAETDIFDRFHWPIDPSSPYLRYILWSYQIIAFYETCAWIFPTVIVLFLSLALSLEYKQFLQDFQKAVSKSGELQDNIGTFRLRHQGICQLTSVVDDMTYVYNGIGGGLALGFVILDLTLIVWYQSIRDNPMVLSLAVFWMIVTLLIISFIFIGGGIVNHMAHAPVSILYKIKFVCIKNDTALNVNLFLNRLTSSSIGISVMRMFVIDKPAIMSIIGAFLSYFIVIIQFQQSSSPAPPDMGTTTTPNVTIGP